MDPEANLEEQRELAQKIQNWDGEFGSDLVEHGQRLAELVLALDEWISKGVLPEAWKKPES